MEKIGVLALQGSFAEHLQILGRIPGIEATAVKTIDELNAVDRLIHKQINLRQLIVFRTVDVFKCWH